MHGIRQNFTKLLMEREECLIKPLNKKHCQQYKFLFPQRIIEIGTISLKEKKDQNR